MTKNIRENILAFMRSNSYAPMTAENLIEALTEKKCNPVKLWQGLLEMEQNGEIVKTRFETYGLPEKMGLVTGRFQFTSKGFGFVIPDNKGDRTDVFIPPSAVNGAMNNDRVMARINNAAHGKKPEGEVIRIIAHANNKVIGVFHRSRDFAFVTPDDKRLGQDIYIAARNFNGAKENQKVVVEITEWPEDGRSAEGRVHEILGNLGDVGLEILSIIKQNDLPLEFPPEVLAAAKKVPDSIKKRDLCGRRDLRKRSVVTVDGEDAKDLDDAVYLEKTAEGEFLLGVYIADVSYYVTDSSVLDREAAHRSTSVYLVDRVLPMLPVRLSNGICSLNAGEDRLVIACEMQIDRRGEIRSYEIFPAVINVRHRLSYNIVRRLLEEDGAEKAKYSDILPMIYEMDDLREILHTKRSKRGAIDFDLPEQKVILDDNLKPVEIVQRVHGNAESIIEEFMLAANETVAAHMSEQKWPFIYRVHDVPDEEKMNDFGKLLANFNIKFRGGENVRPIDVQNAINAMSGRPEERMVNTVALRCMRQAVYQTENIGHFGLAAKYYTHFTSPIRRYPDLIVHRLLRLWLQNPIMIGDKEDKLGERLSAIAEHASVQERVAADAERATVELKKAEYMAGHIGEEFSGVISGVTAFGMFVELDNGVEGLVHISSLMDDYYEFYEEHYALIGTHTRKQYRLGDKVRIEVLQVNISDTSIDFIMAGENDGVREHIKQQLLSRQRHASVRGQKRINNGGANSKAQKKKADRKDGNKKSRNKKSGARRSRYGKTKDNKGHRKNSK